MFPDFPAGGGEALTAWRKLPGAHEIERAESVPGLDASTYVETKHEERRNLFRVPLPADARAEPERRVLYNRGSP